MLIVGIDPGQKGAVVFLQGQSIHHIESMKDISWFADLMESYKVPLRVYIERAQYMGKFVGGKHTFTYGQHYGELLGVLTAFRIPFETVPPATWTKAIHQTTSKTMTAKAKSLQAVQRLFPGVSLTDPLSERAKKPHDGIVDALLIAEYGRRQWIKN